MNDDDDLPSSFDLLVWGPQHPRVLAALSRAKLPQGVQLSTGPLGAVVKIPLFAQPEWMELLIARLERAQLEGGLQLGLLPDRPLNAKQLRDEWASALRTRGIAVRLTPRESSMPVGFTENWWLDDF
jgi:hypothetical protein